MVKVLNLKIYEKIGISCFIFVWLSVALLDFSICLFLSFIFDLFSLFSSSVLFWWQLWQAFVGTGARRIEGYYDSLAAEGELDNKSSPTSEGVQEKWIGQIDKVAVYGHFHGIILYFFDKIYCCTESPICILILIGLAQNFSWSSCFRWGWKKCFETLAYSLCETQPISWLLPGKYTHNTLILIISFYLTRVDCLYIIYIVS